MKFLIQTFNGKIEHDFSFTLLKSIEYYNWLNYGDNIFEVKYTNDVTKPGYIPIGSVEFVNKYLFDYYNLTPKPKNIPIELMDFKWTGRKVFNGTEKDINGRMFVKSNDKVKHFTEICNVAPEGNYQISETIDIISEWRAFIYQSKLVGLQNYSGQFYTFPNVSKIKKMILAYDSQPVAYTLDVAICGNKTVIIEVHDFYSCGLYGFSDYKILPYMFGRWFNEYLRLNGRSLNMSTKHY